MGRLLCAAVFTLACVISTISAAGEILTTTEISFDPPAPIYGEPYQAIIKITRLELDTVQISGTVHLYVDGDFAGDFAPYDPYFLIFDEETQYYYVNVYIPFDGTLPAGEHEITVVFEPDDGETEGSDDTAILLVVPADASINASVSADNQTKVYGDPIPALTATVTGTVNGDVLDFTLSTIADETSGAGNYPIVVTLGSNPNYNVTATDGILTINPRPAMIAADSQVKTYGDAVSPLAATVTGTVNGDSLVYDLFSEVTQVSDSGSYPILVLIGDAADNPNYAVSTFDGIFAVLMANVNITVTGYSTTYDRQPHTATGTATGVFGEDLSAGLDLSNTTHTLAGSYTLAAGNVDVWIFMGGTNYNDAAGAVDDEIGRRAATWVTNPNFKDFGDADPSPLTDGFGVEFIAEDNVTATYSREAGETVGFYHITATLSEGTLDNYNILNLGADFEIRNHPPVALAQVVDDANQITGEDQQFEVASQCQTLVQLIGANSSDPDNDTLAFHWTAIKHTETGDVAVDLGAAADTANPAVYVSPGSYEFTLTVTDPAGDASSDSIIVEIVDTTPPAITLVGPNPQTIIYHHGSTYTDLGADASDSCSAALSGPAVQFQSGMGLVAVPNVDETVPGTYFVTWTATDPSGNSSTVTRTVIITKALLTITANDDTRLYGAANPAFSGAITGRDPADSIVVNYNSSADSSSPVGDYPIVPTVVNLATWQQFYDVVVVNGTLHVIGSSGGNTTYTQGGWGAVPRGKNPGALLHANFTAVYGSLCEVGIPGTAGYSMKFTSASAITAYLPAGGTPRTLTGDLTNPKNSPAGVFGGQTLALKLNVDFSAAGITGSSFGALKLTNTGTSLDGSTVAQILAAAQQALGGGTLPAGYTLSSLNGLCDNLNRSFDNGVASSWAQAHLTN